MAAVDTYKLTLCGCLFPAASTVRQSSHRWWPGVATMRLHIWCFHLQGCCIPLAEYGSGVTSIPKHLFYTAALALLLPSASRAAASLASMRIAVQQQVSVTSSYSYPTASCMTATWLNQIIRVSIRYP
eukprot:GHUV01052862.1.p1 GENE.GHUV01052862.1~~GHUV01052862.1.p1  ORF type:complete len:128 (-),score=19.99 GHUV01052862.1:188-571(-)